MVELVSTLMMPLVFMKLMALMMPKSKPEATMAGMMGTKMSPRTLMAFMKGFCCSAAASLASSLEAAVMWPSEMNSS